MAEHDILRLTRPDGKRCLVFVGQIVTIEPVIPGMSTAKAKTVLTFSSGKEHFVVDTVDEIEAMLG